LLPCLLAGVVCLFGEEESITSSKKSIALIQCVMNWLKKMIVDAYDAVERSVTYGIVGCLGLEKSFEIFVYREAHPQENGRLVPIINFLFNLLGTFVNLTVAFLDISLFVILAMRYAFGCNLLLLGVDL
jgi:hypothetical protein